MELNLPVTMNKNFSIKYFMGTLLSIVVLSIPGCLNGRNILDTLKVYIEQVKENPDWIFYNYPGISYLFGFGYDVRDARLLAIFNLLVLIVYFIYYIRKTCPNDVSA